MIVNGPSSVSYTHLEAGGDFSDHTSDNEEISARFYSREEVKALLKTQEFSSRSQMAAFFFTEDVYKRQVLDLSGIPLLAKDRTEEDPIVIGGGPCSYNPEPIAEFFDLFYIGEGETAYRKLLDVYKEVKEKGGSRQEFLLRAAREVSGMYVPSLYAVSYTHLP